MIRGALVIAVIMIGTQTWAAGPTVLVETMAAARDDLPDLLVSYGIAKPALDSSMTISLQSPGRVLRFFVTPGEAVEAGQPLLDFAVSQSSLGSFLQAETALKTAQIDRIRIARLVTQQLATKDQLTTADKVIADAQTTLDTLRKSGADRPELQIKAPFAGVVSSIPVAQGDTVAQGAPMMAIMRTDGLVVSVGIEPSQRLRVKKGNHVDLVGLTDGGRPVGGEIVRIDGLLNPKTHLVDADVATTAALLPGAAFEARIEIGRLRGFVVPRDAVLSDDRGPYVFQIVERKAHRINVTIVGTHNASTVVTGPIDPAAEMIVKGNYQLDEGTVVRVSSKSPISTSGMATAR